MPFVVNAAHQEGTIKLHGSCGKQRPILKETRFYFLNLHRLHLPIHAPQLPPENSPGFAVTE